MGHLTHEYGQGMTREDLPALDDRRVLLTGATGFLGRHVLRALRAAGAAVCATHLPSEHPQFESGVSGISLDITDHDALRALFEELQPDTIVHCAAHMGSERSYAFAETAMRVNFLATHSMLLAAGDGIAGLRRIVLIGSAEEYGDATEIPLHEDMPARPVSPYSASKAAVTQSAILYHTLFGLPVTVLRPFIIYGPEQAPWMMLPQLIRHAHDGRDFPMTPGEQTRDFVYVEDVARAILLAIAVEEASGQIFNICSGEERSIRSVAEETVRLMGNPVRLDIGALPYRSNEAMRLVGSNDKARRILGWTSRIPFDEGLVRTIDWYRRHGFGE